MPWQPSPERPERYLRILTVLRICATTGCEASSKKPSASSFKSCAISAMRTVEPLVECPFARGQPVHQHIQISHFSAERVGDLETVLFQILAGLRLRLPELVPAPPAIVTALIRRHLFSLAGSEAAQTTVPDIPALLQPWECHSNCAEWHVLYVILTPIPASNQT